MHPRYPDRIRYLGALDDELIRARSINAEPPDIGYVNNTLAQEVLFGVPLALNDGHLFHYGAGRQAITDRDASPLLDLIECGYVTVLSRNGDLSEMPQSMQHIPSYRALIQSTDWLIFHQRLRETQRLLQDGFNLRTWPQLDFGAGFARLLKLSIEQGRAIETVCLNGISRDRVHELFGTFEERLRNASNSAARTVWNNVCDAALDITPTARLALRWLALETYHHNFAMTMSTVFPAGGMGVVTRCSDIYGFTHEEPWVTDDQGVPPSMLPVPRLSPRVFAAFRDGQLLAEIVKPGSRLNRAKTDYLVAISQALSNRSYLPLAESAANEYSRLLAEHFAASTRTKAEVLLRAVTAAFGAVAGGVLGGSAGAITGSVIGNVAAQGAVAGLVSVVDKYIPILMQTIRAASGYLPVQYHSDVTDQALSRAIVAGQALASVTISDQYVREHAATLPKWSAATY